MDVRDIPEVAEYLLRKHGLAAEGWTFKWDNARVRAGCCRYRSKEITVSRHYAELNVAERLDDVVDTILHEIAHALAPGDGHGGEWRAACARVGARPARCYDSEVVIMPEGRYVATCGGCGRTFSRHRALARGRWLYCRECGRTDGRLAFVDTASTRPTVPTVIDTADQTVTPPRPNKLR